MSDPLGMRQANATAAEFVQWFRDTSPYINQHRGKTFVITFGGEAVESKEFEQIVHDIALLNSLGIRLVIVHGIRPQIDQRLKQGNLAAAPPSQFHLGRRVTTLDILPAVIEAAGATRVAIEAALSMGLANSPMHEARIRLHSGNLITAKPLGVIEGVDYNHTGVVRKVDHLSIAQQLAYGNIVLISPLGYSPTGEVFNLCYESVAAEVAVSVRADKLIYLTGQEGVMQKGEVLREVSPVPLTQDAAKENGKIERVLESSIMACQQGIARVHLVGFQRPGAMLLELFTRDGVGTMLAVDEYEVVRYATIDDVAGIIELIRPLEQGGVLVRRSRERLEQEVQQFTVIVRDGAIVAAGALFPDRETGYAELACFVVCEQYRSQRKGDKLLANIEQRAKGLGMNKLFVLTTQTAHWFIEHGFVESSVDSLPIERQSAYNYQRRSKVFVKSL